MPARAYRHRVILRRDGAVVVLRPLADRLVLIASAQHHAREIEPPPRFGFGFAGPMAIVSKSPRMALLKTDCT